MPSRPPNSVLPNGSSRASIRRSHNGLLCPWLAQCESSRSGYPVTRPFSSSSSRLVTLQRRKMFAWLNGPGKVFRDPLPGSTNYLNAYTPEGKLIRTLDRNKRKKKGKDEEGAEATSKRSDEDGEEGKDEAEEAEEGEGQGELNLATVGRDGKGKALPKERREDLRPFPDNVAFQSEAVLSEELKQRIYDDVTKRDVTVREVSEKYQVDIRRVGAVVRLKAIEEAWIKEGKSLARPYARAVLSMLPQTRPGQKHEEVNDLPVHRSTMAQLFYPVSESRAFTRADAGEVFQHGLLPAEKRIAHPQMVRMLNDDSLPTNLQERREALKAQMRAEDAKAEARATAKDRRREANTTRVKAPRADFCFENVVVNKDSTSRTRPGIGSRYGVPHQDRKKGEVKIPRKVE